jgi:hypothetical protein
MKATNMSEPISGTAASVLGWKLIGGLAGLGAIGAGLAAIVVMCAMRPRSSQEWAIGIISTVMASVCGGAAVIQHFNLQAWAFTPFGLVAMLGLAFACGLPGWALVRWLFNYVNKHRDDDIADVARDAKGLL